MDPEVTIGGLRVPLEQTPFGPRVAADHDEDLDLLRWVVNSALDGELHGLAESIERGESRSDGTAWARPLDPRDDIATARERWRARTGGSLSDDAVAVGVQWRGREFVLPRRVLAELVRRLTAMSHDTPKPPGPWLFTPAAMYHEPAPDEEHAVRQLETRAEAFDTLASRAVDVGQLAVVAAKRRLLLAELEQYGILTGPAGRHRARWLEAWGLPTLLSYQRAAIAIGVYWSSGPRRERIGPPPVAASVLGASVSVDWFRYPVPTPHDWDADDWLAFCERTLLDSRDDDAQEGEIFVHRNEGRFSIRWRRDDAVHRCVVHATAR